MLPISRRKIVLFEDEIESERKLKKEKDNKDLSSDIKKEMDKLNERLKILKRLMK